MKKAKVFKVIARLYSEVAEYYKWDKNHEFPRYNEVNGTEREFDLEGATLKDGTIVISLKTSEMWLIENHPAYLQDVASWKRLMKMQTF